MSREYVDRTSAVNAMHILDHDTTRTRVQLKSIVKVAANIESENDEEARKRTANFVAEYVSDSLGGYRRKPSHYFGKVAHSIHSWVPCVCCGALPFRFSSLLISSLRVH